MFTPDAANLVTAGLDPVQEIRLGAGRMVGLHIRDATPSTCYNLPIGTGTLDFDGLFAALRNWNSSTPSWWSCGIRTILQEQPPSGITCAF